MAEKTISLSNLTAYNDKIKATYQAKTDNTLTTTNKTITGAINENKTQLDNIASELQGHLDNHLESTNADTVDGLHFWSGTQAQYDAITTKDPNTVYVVEDDIKEIPNFTSADGTKILAIKPDGSGLEWVVKPTGGSGLILGETSTTAYRGDRGKIAYDHSQVAHAPSTAQKNSDITKAEIEAKLTGVISSHSHANDGTGGSETSIFQGRTATFYGDSITEVNGHYTKGYHSWVQDILGLSSYENFGVSGYKLSDIYTKIDTTTATGDIIFVLGGINDQLFNVEFGAIEDDSTNTTYGSLNLICSKLKEKYTTKLIIFITPHFQTGYIPINGKNSYYISQAIKDTCSRFAIPVYDNFLMSGIYPQNAENKRIFFNDNGIHLNNNGHELVGKNLSKFMLNNFGYIYGTASSSVYGQIVLNKNSISITEGSAGTFTVSLDKAPTNNQVVTLSKTNTDVTLDKTTLTFTPSNYSTAQTVTITVAEDSDYSNEADTITVTSHNVATKTVNVSITDNDTAPSNIPVTGVTLNENSATITGIGVTHQLVATVSPSDATNKNITWSSSNTAKVTVSATGLVTSVAAGTAIVTATTQDGSKTATCNITINDNTPSGDSINIFNKSTMIEKPNFVIIDGVFVASGAFKTAIVPVLPNTQYSLQKATAWKDVDFSPNEYGQLAYLDSGKNIITAFNMQTMTKTTDSKGVTFTTGSTTNYLAFAMKITDTTMAIQVSKGNWIPGYYQPFI